jgi:hypothetical protein
VKHNASSSERASTLNSVLLLQDVALYALEAKHVHHQESPKLGFSMNLGEAVWTRSDTGVAVFLRLDVSIDHVVNAEHTKLSTLAVTFQLTYGARAPLAPDAPVADYVALASWLQAWPYFRAEVQALSTKLGYPPLVVPVLLPGQTADVAVREQKDHRLAQPSTPAKPKAKRRAR